MQNFLADYLSDKGKKLLIRSIHTALDEDGEDLTSNGLFAPDESMQASIIAKESTLLVGIPLIPLIFEAFSADYSLDIFNNDGERLLPFTEVIRIHSTARNILRAERIILNFMCHLSGIANLTAQYVKQLEGTGVKLLDTRKTLPGLRWPEKYAVVMGGAFNHRRNLEEMLMLKDNHIDAAGSISAAVEKLRKMYGNACPLIEVECRTLEHVQEAVSCDPRRIMMDNMDLDVLSKALEMVPPTIETEVSGGITLENIRDYALAGKRRTDYISVGRLTHSAPSADYSMLLSPAAKA